MLKKAVIEVQPGEAGAYTVESPGNHLRAKEADYPFEISFDDGDWLPWDVGMVVRATVGSVKKFQRFKVRHFGPTAGLFIFLIGSDVDTDDGRLTISEGRSGSATSYIPPNLSPFVSREGVGGVVVNTWYELLPYDAGRAEVWLFTDAAAAGYWGLTNADTPTPAFNLYPASAAGRWTKLTTKAAIFVRHAEAGKSITALSFGF